MRVPVLAILSCVLVGGCAGSDLTPGETASRPSQELTMPGRWIVAAPNAPSCGLTFTGAPGATAGRVSPDGGCPDRFFLSRAWTLDGNALTITDADNTALATLTFAEGGFAGRTAAGTPVQISR